MKFDQYQFQKHPTLGAVVPLAMFQITSVFIFFVTRKSIFQGVPTVLLPNKTVRQRKRFQIPPTTLRSTDLRPRTLRQLRVSMNFALQGSHQNGIMKQGVFKVFPVSSPQPLCSKLPSTWSGLCLVNCNLKRVLRVTYWGLVLPPPNLNQYSALQGKAY